jgi:hypothetical protein
LKGYYALNRSDLVFALSVVRDTLSTVCFEGSKRGRGNEIERGTVNMRYTKPQILDKTKAGQMVQTNEPPKFGPFIENNTFSPNAPAAYESDE